MIGVLAQSIVALVLWVAGSIFLLAACSRRVEGSTRAQMGVARVILGLVSGVMFWGALAFTISAIGG